MKSPVSLEYVVTVALLAVTAAVLSYVMPHPALSLTALILGIYALHLVSVRIVVRQYAGVAPARRPKKAAETAAEIRQMREELDLERRELDNRKAELQGRITAAEQQYEMLRQMIRERVEAGATAPAVTSTPQQAWTEATPQVAVPGSGSDGPQRVHGRW